MTKKYHDIMTPTWGRLVGGSTTKPQTKDFDGNPLVYKSGPKEGESRKIYFIPVAINKSDTSWGSILNAISAAGREGFPELFNADGSCNFPEFSFKITDGDSTTKSRKGRAPCDNEGYPGHWIVNFSSDTQPQCFSEGKLCDPAMIKPGDYVQVAGSVCENGSQGNPGVFLNHDAIQLIRHGEEIKFAPDAAERFAAVGNDTTTVPAWVTSVAPTMTAAYPNPFLAAGPPAPPTSGEPPMPPAPVSPPKDIRYLYNGVEYTREQLSIWPQSEVDKLEQVDLNDIPF